MNHSDRSFMEEALDLALRAREEGEVPVGAVVVLSGRKIGEGWNRGSRLSDPTAHGEVSAIRMACEAQGNYRIPGAVLYVTIEPCFMCFGAILESRIGRLVFAAREPRRGVVGSLYDLHNDPRLNHRVLVEEGLMREESLRLMKEFFATKRGGNTGSRGSEDSRLRFPPPGTDPF